MPQFTFAEGSSTFGDLVFLDASASVLPADGVAAYEWFYNNRRIGAGSTLIVRQSSFAELVGGQGSVRIQLQVTVGRSVETATQVVGIGEPETEEPIEPEVPEVPGELVTGTERTFSLMGEKWQLPTSMEFVWIESGTFWMGSPDSEEGRGSHEGPVHEVEISKGFWLGKYEVTAGEWELVMGRVGSADDNRFPKVNVSWHDVHELIGLLNDAAGDSLYRLPTEAEWEYACRAGTTPRSRWSFGDDEDQLGDYAWYRGNSSNSVKEVGGKLPNPWGLYDMHGNVWEWVQDWYDADYYNRSPRVDPPGPDTGSKRVIRGGRFGNLAQGVRSADRDYVSPGFRSRHIGVRLLRIR